MHSVPSGLTQRNYVKNYYDYVLINLESQRVIIIVRVNANYLNNVVGIENKIRLLNSELQIQIMACFYEAKYVKRVQRSLVNLLRNFSIFFRNTNSWQIWYVFTHVGLFYRISNNYPQLFNSSNVNCGGNNELFYVNIRFSSAQ